MSQVTSALPTLDETLGQFDQLLGTDVAVSTRPSPLGEVFSACQAAAKLLGLSGTPIRGSVRPDATVIETANVLGLSAREVSLSGEWWKNDHGIMVLKDETTDKPILVRSCHGRTAMEFSGPIQFVKFQPITLKVAQTLKTTAVVLYPTLPDSPTKFSDVLMSVLKLYPFEALVYLALTVIIAVLTYSVPVASGMIIDHAVPHRNELLLTAVISIVVVCNLIMLALRYTSELIVQRLEAMAGTQLQAAVLERLFRLPLQFFASHNTADVMRRFTSLEGARRSSLRMIVTTSMDFATLTVGIATLVYYFPFGALAVVAVSALSLLIAFILAKASFSAYSEGEAMTTNVLTVVYELIGNMLPIRMFGAQRRAFLRWRDNFVEMRRRTVRSSAFSNRYAAVQQSLSLVTLGTVFAVVTYSAKGAQSDSVGHYVAFVGSVSLVTGTIASLASSLMGFFSLKPSISLATPILTGLPEAATGRSLPSEIKGDVEFAAIDFRYAEQSPLVLNNFSFAVKAGQYVGIVGTSGCGKSTLLKIMLGLLAPTKGQVYFDKNDLAAVNMDQVRRQCGVVLQDCRMFSGSILDNISSGRDFEVEQILAVLDAVGLGPYVRGLPMGIHTVVGEGTTAFSGGQVQLMALARELVGSPKLLIFDEATSALDNVSVQKIGDIIDGLPLTRIIFTHRLGTLKNCDQVIVLDGGCVAQQGTFAELSQQNGLFKSMLHGKVD